MATPLKERKDSCCGKAPGVIHLPVAPHVTARTRFSIARPGRVQFIMPHEAIVRLEGVMADFGDSVEMVAITGPGDPLAVPDTTIKTVELVRERYPEMKIGLKTLGIGGERFAGNLAEAGVDYVEMQVNGVQADILKRLYAWIRPGLKTLKIAEAVELLIMEQRNSVPALKYNGLEVSIITTLYPGYNIDHVQKISSNMMELGADSISLVPYMPKPDSEVTLQPPEPNVVEEACRAAGNYLPVVRSLLTCEEEPQSDNRDTGKMILPKPSVQRPNVAVVSSNGIEIDLHLGQAISILVYGPREDGLACLLEKREVPEAGGGSVRWQKLAKIVQDCFVILAASAGEAPHRILSEQGITVILTEENIEGCVDVLYGGGKKGKEKCNKK